MWDRARTALSGERSAGIGCIVGTFPWCTIRGKTPMNRKRWLLAILFVAIVAGVFAILPRSPNHPQPKDFWPPASQYLAAHPDQAGDSRDTSRYVRMRDGVRIAVTTTMP